MNNSISNNISIKETFVLGIRAVFYNGKFVAILFAANFAAALVLTMPLYHVLAANLGHSLMSDKLAFGFDYMWYIQFRNLYKITLAEVPLVIISMAGIYVLVQTFFLGGLIAVFNNSKKNHMVDFFYGGVKYFYRFVKVTLISVVFLACAFKINDWLGDLIVWGFHNSENAMAEFILRSLRYIILVFLIGLVSIVSDYGKVSLAVKDNKKAIKSIYRAILFIKHNFVKVFTVFLFISILGALGAVIYNIIGRFIPRTPYYFLVLSFILQQMLIIFRLLIRMLFYSTEVLLFRDLDADIVAAETRTTE